MSKCLVCDLPVVAVFRERGGNRRIRMTRCDAGHIVRRVIRREGMEYRILLTRLA